MSKDKRCAYLKADTPFILGLADKEITSSELPSDRG